MKIFKTMVLGGLLAAPMVAGAVSTTAVTGVGNFSFTGAGSQQVYNPSQVSTISDNWTVSLLSGESAAVTFNFTNIPGFIFINDFAVNGVNGIFNANINATTAFNITGTTSDFHGGVYTGSVTPGAISAVPVPAAVWFMGSAMVGLFSFRKRKAAMPA